MVGDLVEVLVCHVIQQISHGRVLASTFPKVDELVVQITGRLACDPREIPAVRRAPLLTMACGAGLHPLPHGVRWFNRLGWCVVQANHK
jgi:hypothetical protein